MKSRQKPKIKHHKSSVRKDSFSWYFTLLQPAVGGFAFFFLASVIFRYAVVEQGSNVLGVATSGQGRNFVEVVIHALGRILSIFSISR